MARFGVGMGIQVVKFYSGIFLRKEQWFSHQIHPIPGRPTVNLFELIDYYCDDRCFAVADPRVWNSLPTELRQRGSLGQFKRRLKTHLFGLWDHSA